MESASDNRGLKWRIQREWVKDHQKISTSCDNWSIRLPYTSIEIKEVYFRVNFKGSKEYLPVIDRYLMKKTYN